MTAVLFLYFFLMFIFERKHEWGEGQTEGGTEDLKLTPR